MAEQYDSDLSVSSVSSKDENETGQGKLQIWIILNCLLAELNFQQPSRYCFETNAVPQRAGGPGGPWPPKNFAKQQKFFLLLSKYFDWKDTKLHANYFLYNEKCCFPSYKSNTVSFISINYKSSFFSLCIEIYLCTPCALFFNCFPKLRELKRTHL